MRLEVSIDGMLAIHARNAVYTALASVDGVLRAEVELGRAELEHAGAASAAAVEQAVRAAIADAGFTVTAVRVLPRRLPTL